jgi:diguanylate cyclase (GGDEF)-like protein
MISGLLLLIGGVMLGVGFTSSLNLLMIMSAVLIFLGGFGWIWRGQQKSAKVDDRPGSMNIHSKPSVKVKVDQVAELDDRGLLEQEINFRLGEILTVLSVQLPEAHSLLFFFPGTTPKTFEYREGLVGGASVLRGGLEINEYSGVIANLLEPENPFAYDSHYNSQLDWLYESSPEIGSIAGVQIRVNIPGRENEIFGVLVVDSLTPGVFTDIELELMKYFSKLSGLLTYKMYMGFQYRRERNQLREIFTYQKEFFQDLRVSEIFKRLMIYVSERFPTAHRVMILERDSVNELQAQVVLAEGRESEGVLKRRLSLNGSGYLKTGFFLDSPQTRKIRPEEAFALFDGSELPPEDLGGVLQIPIIESSSFQGHPTAVVVVELPELPFRVESSIDQLNYVVTSAAYALVRARVFEEKDWASKRDGITQLMNHVTFQDVLRRRTIEAIKTDRALGLILINIDNFKHVNDTWGHQAGDKVIQSVAQAISDCCRDDVDVAARMGGDEFAIIVPSMSNFKLMGFAETLKEAIGDIKLKWRNGEVIKITGSLGIAIAPRDADDAKELYALANDAICMGKSKGKNRVFQAYSKAEKALKNEKSRIEQQTVIVSKSVKAKNEEQGPSF